MQTEYDELNARSVTRTQWCIYVAIGLFISLHIILMSVLVSNLVSITPEVQTTLVDVKEMVPEMRRSLLELGKIIPEITSGMNVLKQLCNASPDCTYTV